MSQHFEDVQYHVGQAGSEPEPSRLGRLGERLRELEVRAEGEAVAQARRRVAALRERRESGTD